MNQPAMTCRSTKSFEADATLVVVVEMSRSVWLVAGLLPGIDRRPLKKMTPDENELVVLLEHWRGEVAATGRSVRRVVVAYEAGRDGFWLARWLRARDIRVRGHPRQQHSCIKGQEAGENRSARHSPSNACVAGMATR